MEKEFKSLSEKMPTKCICKTHEKACAEDIKEFIRLEAKLIERLILGKISDVEFWEERNKLAGDKLTKS